MNYYYIFRKRFEKDVNDKLTKKLSEKERRHELAVLCIVTAAIITFAIMTLAGMFGGTCALTHKVGQVISYTIILVWVIWSCIRDAGRQLSGQEHDARIRQLLDEYNYGCHIDMLRSTYQSMIEQRNSFPKRMGGLISSICGPLIYTPLAFLVGKSFPANVTISEVMPLIYILFVFMFYIMTVIFIGWFIKRDLDRHQRYYIDVLNELEHAMKMNETCKIKQDMDRKPSLYLLES